MFMTCNVKFYFKDGNMLRPGEHTFDMLVDDDISVAAAGAAAREFGRADAALKMEVPVENITIATLQILELE